MVLIVGIAPNYATFYGRDTTGDASPTRVIVPDVASCVVRNSWEKEEPRENPLFFNYVLLLDQHTLICGSFSESREIASLHIYFPPLFLRETKRDKGERTTFSRLRRQVWIKCAIPLVARTILSDRRNLFFSRRDWDEPPPISTTWNLTRKLLKSIYLKLLTAHSFMQNIVYTVHSPPTYIYHILRVR